ncbi:DUF3182 family protein [Chitinasiproducens palmae]|uniref:Biotin carboxylase n=1 Tax=Chitinasiproducens palmae TaxID=1770053 RepID=A0A1H2PW83_9BURK|nr:DUF3182 family protein [Chitinasiproducens palmae]SDV50772.1 Protein of unknown function [Chitinasiproducens palmae]
MNAQFLERATVVAAYSGGRKAASGEHERETQYVLTAHVAALLGARLGAPFDALDDAGDAGEAAASIGDRYLVPDDTLTLADATRLRIRDEDDFFGGVVPYPFVATKVVVHGLVPGARHKPTGWADHFADAVRGLVLPGFSAFCSDDARTATALLQRGGEVRLKRPSGIGGVGQAVLEGRDDLEAHLEAIGEGALREEGVVLERNLRNIATFSVGRTHIRGFEACYYGVQRLTRNNHGLLVYGGSDLVVARGGFEALERTRMTHAARAAVKRARQFDAAIGSAYPSFFASRRNYDVASGADANGRRHRGVLEQSWRLGGASGAEIGALRAFADDPALDVVRASTVERYGAPSGVPDAASVLYRDVDPRVGVLTKYATVGTGPDAGRGRSTSRGTNK